MSTESLRSLDRPVAVMEQPPGSAPSGMVTAAVTSPSSIAIKMPPPGTGRGHLYICSAQGSRREVDQAAGITLVTLGSTGMPGPKVVDTVAR